MSKFYKEIVTKAKHIELHLDHSKNYSELESKLEAIGYKKYNDFKIICERGYEMKEVIRLMKSNIKKDIKAFNIIKDYLLSEEAYNSLKSTLHYPLINKITPCEL